MMKKFDFKSMADLAEEDDAFPLEYGVDEGNESEESVVDGYLDGLAYMKDLLDEEENESLCGASAAAIHNLTVEYARRGDYRQAMDVCDMGLREFPLDDDLLADAIQYSIQLGEISVAEEYFRRLKESVPLRRWRWRAYSFSLSYLFLKPVENADEIRELLAQYKHNLPHEERAYMAEAEFFETIGDYIGAMKVLRVALNEYTNARLCALKLAEMEVDRGAYVQALGTISYGIAASVERMPTVNVAHFFVLRVLCNDFLLHKKESEGEGISEEAVSSLETEYKLLLEIFSDELGPYIGTILARLKSLRFMKGVS